MLDIIRKLGNNSKHILVAGDVMLDKYIYGTVTRVSPEAPIPVLTYTGEKLCAGGAANVANNIISLDSKVTLLSVIGGDAAGKSLLQLIKSGNICTDAIFKDPDRVTTVKTRVVAQNNQQLLRIDNENVQSISEALVSEMLDFVEQKIEAFDVIAISDYNKGVMTESLCQGIIKIASEHGKKVLIDPKSLNYKKYRKAYLIKPNKNEWVEMFKGNTDSAGQMMEAMIQIKQELSINIFIVTTGESGMVIADEYDNGHIIPTEVKQVFDPTGCGDTTFSALAVCTANGIPILESVKLANIAAGIKIQKAGVAAVSLQEINDEINIHFLGITRKIIPDYTTLDRIISAEKQQNKKIVFTNGCFDILHFGHVSYLSKAKSFGDILIVGVNSDESIRRLKGEKRPVIQESERVNLLASLQFIDYVIVFDEDTPYDLIKRIQPDVLTKGNDWKKENIAGVDIVEARGGKVQLVSLEDGISTTNVISRILELYRGNN